MKLKRKHACNECPFRKTSSPSPPRIAEAVLAFVHGERAFACHKDFESICVGSLKHANKSCKMYRDPRLKKMQDEVRDGDSSQILNEWEFMAHHNVKPNKG